MERNGLIRRDYHETDRRSYRISLTKKAWMYGKETGVFQGLYEWDTVEDARNYGTSFPLRLMKKRAVPESLVFEIRKK